MLRLRAVLCEVIYTTAHATCLRLPSVVHTKHTFAVNRLDVRWYGGNRGFELECCEARTGCDMHPFADFEFSVSNRALYVAVRGQRAFNCTVWNPQRNIMNVELNGAVRLHRDWNNMISTNIEIQRWNILCMLGPSYCPLYTFKCAQATTKKILLIPVTCLPWGRGRSVGLIYFVKFFCTVLVGASVHMHTYVVAKSGSGKKYWYSLMGYMAILAKNIWCRAQFQEVSRVTGIRGTFFGGSMCSLYAVSTPASMGSDTTANRKVLQTGATDPNHVMWVFDVGDLICRVAYSRVLKWAIDREKVPVANFRNSQNLQKMNKTRFWRSWMSFAHFFSMASAAATSKGLVLVCC